MSKFWNETLEVSINQLMWLGVGVGLTLAGLIEGMVWLAIHVRLNWI